MTKLSREELVALWKLDADSLPQPTYDELADRQRRFDEYMDASAELANLMREAGLDPDVAPVCSCGRTLCRRAMRGEEGHADAELGG